MAEQIYYRIIKAELTQFATLTDSFDPKEKLMQNNEMSLSFDAANSVLSCTYSFILRDEHDAPLMKASMLCGFELKKESLEAITQNGVVKIPSSALCHMASLTYSAMRGAISVKAEDTAFRSYVLPFCNVSEHIKSSVSFRLSE